MDLDPFRAGRHHADTMRFLDVFLLHCLLCDSPPDTPQEIAATRAQQAARRRARPRAGPAARARRGRRWRCANGARECWPNASRSPPRSMRRPAARRASRTLAAAVAALGRSGATPSARVLQAMARDTTTRTSRFVLAQSRRHRDAIAGLPLEADVGDRFARLAEGSLRAQHEQGSHRHAFLRNLPASCTSAPVRLNE